MIIKKYTHKGKGYFKGFEHIFEYFDDNRKVDINTTGDIICRIKKRLDFYSNSTNENINITHFADAYKTDLELSSQTVLIHILTKDNTL